jgi:serine/threonine-protein kinase
MMAGEIIVGRYELGERLGVGGMSTVQLAFDRRLERNVAVKLLAEHLADDEQFVSRFRREALAAARLVHPNVVQVFDFGLDERSGRHYIVMEYIRGQSGAEILRERGRLGVDETLDLVTQACRGLDYAHRNGVVHRDVKPGNLLRADDGGVKLADFGIAKALSEESSITQAGSVLGTASYLAPEQAMGEEAGPAADIYGLGVVTYQLLSGRLPYEANSLTELALKQQREAPSWLHELDPAIPETLAVAVDRALSLDPADRWQSADAMRVALTDGARGVGDATAATRVARPGTEATSIAPAAAYGAAGRGAGDPATAQGVTPRVPRQPRQPRPVPAGAVAAPAPAAAPPQRRRRRRGRVRRTIGTMFVLLMLAGGGAAAVIATSNDKSAVHLRTVAGNKVSDVVNQLKDLVSANTR